VIHFLNVFIFFVRFKFFKSKKLFFFCLWFLLNFIYSLFMFDLLLLNFYFNCTVANCCLSFCCICCDYIVVKWRISFWFFFSIFFFSTFVLNIGCIGTTFFKTNNQRAFQIIYNIYGKIEWFNRRFYFLKIFLHFFFSKKKIIIIKTVFILNDFF